MTLINKAAAFAEKAHYGQRYGAHAYDYHLSQVAAFTANRTKDTDIQITCIMVAWLHDVLEDTDVSYKDIEFEFGTAVAHACSILDKTGKEYKEYMEEILKCTVAREVKICDTMSNLANSMADNREKNILKYSKQLHILMKGEFYEVD